MSDKIKVVFNILTRQLYKIIINPDGEIEIIDPSYKEDLAVITKVDPSQIDYRYNIVKGDQYAEEDE